MKTHTIQGVGIVREDGDFGYLDTRSGGTVVLPLTIAREILQLAGRVDDLETSAPWLNAEARAKMESLEAEVGRLNCLLRERDLAARQYAASLGAEAAAAAIRITD